MSDYQPPGLDLPTAPEPLQGWVATMEELLVQGRELLTLYTNLPAAASAEDAHNPEDLEIMEVAHFPPPRANQEPHPGSLPLFSAPTDVLTNTNLVDNAYLYDRACIGNLPSKSPGLTLGTVHLAHHYYITKNTGIWHCRNCHKLEHTQGGECFFVETHSVILLDRLTGPFDPQCRCGAPYLSWLQSISAFHARKHWPLTPTCYTSTD